MADLKSGIPYCFPYDFKRGKTAAESLQTCAMLLGRTSSGSGSANVHTFRFGNERLEDDARGRPPSVVDMEQLKEAIEEDPDRTTRDLANRRR
ncbi:hypothetical protein ANCDUO_07720 [Ancylostoma duodenale]|uniref:Uncharacterized protein n=1 Tax=Ancylostoma duodenale TaxID=51022 RepID=A0A0C2GXX2_9BILA|nr:hypothetical protein ANCDUO_07720 [Ancylostoma duodenale]